ncbi:MAG: DUF1579 family protein [Ignavibacteriales bacterium]|nr:DUF1579 family protein [Ignavibacteriales bacterium]
MKANIGRSLLGLTMVCFFSIFAEASRQSDSTQIVQRLDEFDFWVGEWDLSWANGGKGTNSIRKILDNMVILENFDGTPSMRLKGMSVSAFDAKTGKWRQTWVDNNGGYLDFLGGLDGGKMILERKTTMNGKTVLQRMVWYNIIANELDWNWERSEDNGKTWKTLWSIHYTRTR